MGNKNDMDKRFSDMLLSGSKYDYFNEANYEYQMQNDIIDEKNNDDKIIEQFLNNNTLMHVFRIYSESLLKEQNEKLNKWTENIKMETQKIEDLKDQVDKTYEKIRNILENNKNNNESQEKDNNIIIAHHGTGKSLVALQMLHDRNKRLLELEKVNHIENSTTLSDCLKESKMTQSELAEMLDVSRETIINIIKRPNSVSLLNAKKIAMIFGKSIDELFPTVIE